MFSKYRAVGINQKVGTRILDIPEKGAPAYRLAAYAAYEVFIKFLIL